VFLAKLVVFSYRNRAADPGAVRRINYAQPNLAAICLPCIIVTSLLIIAGVVLDDALVMKCTLLRGFIPVAEVLLDIHAEVFFCIRRETSQHGGWRPQAPTALLQQVIDRLVCIRDGCKCGSLHAEFDLVRGQARVRLEH